jgi:hypothetical protein
MMIMSIGKTDRGGGEMAQLKHSTQASIGHSFLK